METLKLTPDQLELLRSKLPDDAVSQHPTKTFLSSIKAIYVIERLNKVFGIGSWQLRSEIIDNKTAMIVVKSILSIPAYGIELESYGGNNNGGENSKNFDLGDAYKGATTDALTKICSYLEIGMEVFKGKHKHSSNASSTSAAKAVVKELTATEAVTKINAATTRLEFVKIWNENPKLHADKSVLDAVTKAGLKFPKPQATN